MENTLELTISISEDYQDILIADNTGIYFQLRNFTRFCIK